MIKQTITHKPFPNSKKVYVEGEPFPIKVAMREIAQHPTKLSTGDIDVNTPSTVDETAGPHTYEDAAIYIRKGIVLLREQWILDRGDVQVLDGITSAYGRERLADQSLDDLRFAYSHKPKVAMEGRNVTQLHYARKGIITP